MISDTIGSAVSKLSHRGGFDPKQNIQDFSQDNHAAAGVPMADDAPLVALFVGVKIA